MGDKVIDPREIERRFYEADAALKALTDGDPCAAIEAARALTSDDILNQELVDALAAGTLIDAGVAGRDATAVDDGVGILERLLEAKPDRGDLEYCLANGLSAQADFVSSPLPDWYLDTADMRRKARGLYQSAGAKESTPPHIAAQSYTNLGNSLLCAYRFVEAYDCYLRALACDSTNSVALTGAARVLLRLVQNGTGDPGVLRAVAARYLKVAKENPERIRELAGEHGCRELSRLLESEATQGDLPDLSAATDYQRFVAKHRLALAPTIEGLDLTMSRWDSLRIGSVTEPISTGAGVPPLFAMFNLLKSEFLAARFLTYTALRDALPESGKYSDTLDYARYGIQPSMLTLAQRSCLDLLDKVAVAESEYLALGGDSKSIYFLKRWFQARREGEPLRWQPEIRNEIAAGNTALIALSEVSRDVEAGGFLQEKRALRHSSTHRFTVLHDLGASPSRECEYIDHYGVDAFVGQLIETLQLTRAVLFYFVEMVGLREQRMQADGSARAPLFVPDHAWVRGEKDGDSPE